VLATFFSRLNHEYRAAPLWQKLLLLALVAVLFFFVVIRPSFLVYLKQVRILEIERNELVHQLQANKMLVRDIMAIEKNARTVQETRSMQVWTLPQLKNVLARTIRQHTALVFQCDYNFQQSIDYGVVSAIPVMIKLNVLPAQAEPLLTDLLNIGFGQVRQIDYVNQVMTLDILYVYTNKKAGRQLIQKKPVAKRTVLAQVYPRIQGFFTSGKNLGVICNNRVYRVGERCGKYTILKIQPTLRQVVFEYRGKSITVRK